MSLILEALRKLEREKPTPERASTVLLAPLAWPSPPRRHGWAIAIGLVLVLSAALAVWLLVRGTSRPAARPGELPFDTRAAPRPEPSAALAPEPASSQSLTSPRAVRATAQAPRPAVGRATPAHNAPVVFRLTAIADQEGVPVAVLNDRMVRVGDALLGARIVRITATEVELQRESDGERFTVGF
jgi:hypothetical protein